MRKPANIVAAVGARFGWRVRHNRDVCRTTESSGRSRPVCRRLKYFRGANDLVATGFLVFAVGESLMLIGTATTLTESVPSFAAGLLLTNLPCEFASWTRLTGIIGAILFAVSSARTFLPPASPVPSQAVK